MPARRLEDKIRELCSALPPENAGALSSQSEGTLAELRLAISEYTRRRRNWVTGTALLGADAANERRRSTSDQDPVLYLLVLRGPHR